MKPILNESDCLRDMLEQEKLLTQQYAVFLTESGNQKLRKLMKENLIAKDVDSVLSAFAKEQREMEKDIHSRQKQ